MMKYNVKVPYGWNVQTDPNSAISRILDFLESGADNAEIEVEPGKEARREYARFSNAVGYHKMRDKVAVRMRNGRIFLIRMKNTEEE